MLKRLGAEIKKRATVKRGVVILIVAFLLLILFIVVKCNGGTGLRQVVTNKEILEKCCLVMEIMGFFFASIGVLIAVWQYVLTSRCEINKFRNDCVSKAVDLSEFYKDKILPKYSAIKYLLEDSSTQEIFDSIKIDDIQEFDEIELDKIFSRKEKEAIKEYLNSEQYVRKCKTVYRRMGLKLGVNMPENLTQNEEISFYIQFATDQLYDIMNNMEYFAMYFTHRCADETVVYQSLHQTYFSIVRLLYYNIAINNKQGTDKYFSNMIELFNSWKKRYMERNVDFVKGVRQLVEKGTMADHI